ncbi:hypothetical protein ACLB2K_066182 [Fragaria x ananassa]
MTGLSSSSSQLGPKNLMLGQAIHAFLLKCRCQSDTDAFQGNNLVNLYSKLNRLEDARQIFDEMPVRNTITWTTLMKGCSGVGDYASLFRVAGDMFRGGERFNEHTCSVILEACGLLQEQRGGEQVHCFVVKSGLQDNVFVATSLVSVYSRSDCLGDAEKVFGDMEYRDVQCFNYMILEYGKAGCGEEAIGVFIDLLSSGLDPNDYTFTNVISACSGDVGVQEGRQLHGLAVKYGVLCETSVGNAVITMYGKHGIIEEAETMLYAPEERSLISWTALLSMYVKNGCVDKALDVFLRVHDLGVGCDSSFLCAVLDACSECRDVELGRQIHAFVTKLSYDSGVHVGTALIDIYAKCGNLQSARLVFDGLSGNAMITMYAKCGSIEEAFQMFNGMNNRDCVSWNAIISAYALHGEGTTSLTLFENMKEEGFAADGITLLAILQACSYSGLWETGLCLFNEMELKYGTRFVIEHFGCMVDLLGRAGKFSEAIDFINTSPFPDSPMLWRTLINVCMLCGNLNFGILASKSLLELEPDEAGSYILVSNMYAGGGLFDEAAKVRTVMNDLKVNKEAGCSWIEVDNKFHYFVASDMDHPKSDEIYEKLNLLKIQIKMNSHDSSDLCLVADPS